jgi:hypothetical protein
MAGLDPAIALKKAPPCHSYRDRRVKPGDDERPLFNAAIV